MVAALTIAGAIAGVAAIRLPASTNADVRNAARALVPPGFDVTSESSGYTGDFPPPKGPYHTLIDTRGGGDVESRLALFRRHVVTAGWRVKETREFAGAVVLVLAPRRDLHAEVHLTKPNDLITDKSGVLVERPSTAARQFWWGLAGATAGLALGLAYAWAVNRRRHEGRPS